MNRRVVLYTIGQIVGVEAVVMLLPLAVSLMYGELLFGLSHNHCGGGGREPCRARFAKPRNHVIYARKALPRLRLRG